MTSANWLALAAVLMVVSMAWIALGMENHWKQVYPTFPRSKTITRILKAGGIGGMLAVAGLCRLVDTPGMAVLVWCMLLSVSIGLIALLLAWRPRYLCFFCPLFKNMK